MISNASRVNFPTAHVVACSYGHNALHRLGEGAPSSLLHRLRNRRPRSDLLFSIDGLMEMLSRTRVHVELKVSHIARARRR